MGRAEGSGFCFMIRVFWRLNFNFCGLFNGVDFEFDWLCIFRNSLWLRQKGLCIFILKGGDRWGGCKHQEPHAIETCCRHWLPCCGLYPTLYRFARFSGVPWTAPNSVEPAFFGFRRQLLHYCCLGARIAEAEMRLLWWTNSEARALSCLLYLLLLLGDFVCLALCFPLGEVAQRSETFKSWKFKLLFSMLQYYVSLGWL